MVEHWSTCDSVEYWCKNQMYLILVGLKRHLLLFMSVLSCRSVEICVVGSECSGLRSPHRR